MTPLAIILTFAGFAAAAVLSAWGGAYLSTRRPDSQQRMLAEFSERLEERSRQRGGTPGPMEQALLDEYRVRGKAVTEYAVVSGQYKECPATTTTKSGRYSLLCSLDFGHEPPHQAIGIGGVVHAEWRSSDREGTP